MSPLEALSIGDTDYQFQPQGNVSAKPGMNVLLPGQQVDEIGRVLWTWNSEKSWGSTLTTVHVLGRHDKKATSVTIDGSSSTRHTMNNVNGAHVWVQPDSITSTTHALRVSGTSIDEVGNLTINDNEDITIDSTVDKVYVTDKRWIGNVVLKAAVEGVSPDLSITTDAGIVDPFNFGRLVKVVQQFFARWKPSATPWQMTLQVAKFLPGDTTTGSGGLIDFPMVVGAYPRTFKDTDTTPRTQVGSHGFDWHSQLDAEGQIDPMINAGFIFRIGVKNIDEVELWASFYRY